MSVDYSNNIRKARLQSGLTQEKMAEELRCGRSTYVAYEEGRRQVIPPLIERMAELVGRDVMDVVFGIRLDEQVLRDQADLDEWKRTLVDQYEKRIRDYIEELERRDRTIRELQEQIANLKDIINHQSTINGFLMKDFNKDK